MSQAGANRWVAWILALAALAWLAGAAWTLTAQQERSALGLLGSEAPRDTLLLLLPLAVGWGLVLCGSRWLDRMRALGAVLAQALSLGALAAALLVASVWFPPRTGTSVLTVVFLLASLLPQLPALVAGWRLMPRLGAGVASMSRVPIGVGISATVLSFGLNSALGLYRPYECHATETHALADLLSILRAEAAYAELNHGRFGSLECLVNPTDCSRVPLGGGSRFLDASFLHPIRCGYRFTFHPGQAADGSARTEASTAAPGVDDYAVTAVPLAATRGGRGLCAEASGVIRFSRDGSMPLPQGGRCVSTLEILP